MTYSQIDPLPPKRRFKLVWKDGGMEIIEGRGNTIFEALMDAYRRVGYDSDTLRSLTSWSETK